MTVLRVDTIAGIGTTIGPLFDGNLEFNSQNYIVLPKGSSNQQGVLRTTVDVVGTGGTYYDNLVLAMPFNAATGLRDVSSRNRNPGYASTNSTNNVAISTAQSKYYGSSAYFDGSGDYLSVSASNDFAWGTGDFTIECWINLSSLPATNVISPIIQNDVVGVSDIDKWWFGVINDGGTQRLSFGRHSTSTRAYVNWSLNTNIWYYVAVVRQSGTIKLFIDGVSQTVTNSTVFNNVVFGQNGISVGAISTPYYFNGYIQDLRIYKGIAKYTSTFTPPERIAEVGVGFKTGALRYNTDSNKPELYDGNQWVELQISNVGLGTGGDTGPGARGVFGGGTLPGGLNVIDYVNISSTGNAQDFGDLTQARRHFGAAGSSTRSIFANGTITGGDNYNTLDYITISSTGNAVDFGDTTQARFFCESCSNSTRMLNAGGIPPGGTPYYNIIDYITISSIGNAVDFGDMNIQYTDYSATASPVRALFGGGYSPSASSISYTTISSLGNTVNFGSLNTSGGQRSSACANATRALFIGGASGGYNDIEYVTISSLGNAVQFGTTTAGSGNASCSSPIRGIISNLGNTNIIEYVTIATQGNSVDFGDSTVLYSERASTSNSHGGL